MSAGHLDALFAHLFDDAALFPPASLDVASAARAHARHRLSWYGDMIGPFVANSIRVEALDDEISLLKVEPVDVAVVVLGGLEAVPAAVKLVDSCEHLRLRSVEVPLGLARLAEAARILGPVVQRRLDVYVEIPVVQVRERDVHDLSAAGLRLKLRTGGTRIDAFQTEDQLAAPIVMCAAELLPFKCTAGLHNAVRHRDRGTLFEHHGFLNIALAARAAAATGSVVATSAALAEQAPESVTARIRELGAAGIAATRELFASFGTCTIAEPVGDLTAMGLVSAP